MVFNTNPKLSIRSYLTSVMPAPAGNAPSFYIVQTSALNCMSIVIVNLFTVTERLSRR